MRWGDLEVHGYVHGRIPDYPQPENTQAWLLQSEAALQALREVGLVTRIGKGRGIPFKIRPRKGSHELFLIANAMNAHKYCICGAKARKWSADCDKWKRLARCFKNAPSKFLRVLVTPYLKWCCRERLRRELRIEVINTGFKPMTVEDIPSARKAILVAVQAFIINMSRRPISSVLNSRVITRTSRVERTSNPVGSKNWAGNKQTWIEGLMSIWEVFVKTVGCSSGDLRRGLVREDLSNSERLGCGEGFGASSHHPHVTVGSPL